MSRPAYTPISCPFTDNLGRAYNDMLFLCGKYAPLESLERYDPEKDISVTGVVEAYDINAGV